MFLPKWLVLLASVSFVVLAAWAFLLVSGRNPLPFPDPGSRIFTAPSPEAKDAVVALLARHGVQERFQANSTGILRSIMWDCHRPAYTGHFGVGINRPPGDRLDVRRSRHIPASAQSA